MKEFMTKGDNLTNVTISILNIQSKLEDYKANNQEFFETLHKEVNTMLKNDYEILDGIIIHWSRDKWEKDNLKLEWGEHTIENGEDTWFFTGDDCEVRNEFQTLLPDNNDSGKYKRGEFTLNINLIKDNEIEFAFT